MTNSHVHNGLFVDYCAKDFLDGTQQLGPWEELAYRRIVDLIYASNDRLADDDKKLAWMTKTGSRWPKIKHALVEVYGKLEVIDGRLTNRRCREQLAKTAQKIEQKRVAGKASAAARNSMENNETGATAVATGVITDVPTNHVPTNLSSKNKNSTPSHIPKDSTGPTGPVGQAVAYKGKAFSLSAQEVAALQSGLGAIPDLMAALRIFDAELHTKKLSGAAAKRALHRMLLNLHNQRLEKRAEAAAPRVNRPAAARRPSRDFKAARQSAPVAKVDVS